MNGDSAEGVCECLRFAHDSTSSGAYEKDGGKDSVHRFRRRRGEALHHRRFRCEREIRSAIGTDLGTRRAVPIQSAGATDPTV